MRDSRLCESACSFATILQECALKENIDTLFMGFDATETVKLLAKGY